jgi:hypothetical protein
MSSRSSAAATMTLATSPYACAQVWPDRESMACPRNRFEVASRLSPTAAEALSHHREATVITAVDVLHRRSHENAARSP